MFVYVIFIFLNFTLRSLSLNIKSSAPLKHRYANLRNSISRRKNRPKALKSIFHLNVFEGEFDESCAPTSFDQPHDPDIKRRELLSNLETFQQSLEHRNQELADRENTVSNLSIKVENLSARNTFLTRHYVALHEETREQQLKLGRNYV